MNVEPWYRSPEVLATIAVFIVIVLLLIYMLRQRYSIARNVWPLDQRIADQTRLERDLNDSLLRSVEVSKRLAENTPSKYNDVADVRQALEKLSAWLGQATEEGKFAPGLLRPSTEERKDLVDAHGSVTEELTAIELMEVTFALVGEVQEMQLVVRNEIYRIGYEAIRNAYMHSKATNLRVQLEFGHHLSLCITDNGIQFDLSSPQQREGLYSSLQQMREAASRIGGELTISGSASLGTEVLLRIPESLIFRKDLGQKGTQS